jgi:hypothetical protein
MRPWCGLGLPETIGRRTSLYLAMILISLAAMIGAGMLRNRLNPRFRVCGRYLDLLRKYSSRTSRRLTHGASLRSTSACSSPAATSSSQNQASGFAPVAIESKRSDSELVIGLGNLRLQEMPTGAFLIVRHRDHEMRSTRENFSLFGGRICTPPSDRAPSSRPSAMTESTCEHQPR